MRALESILPSLHDKLSRLRADVHMQEIFRKASVAFALKVVGAGLAFVFHIAIARLLGATGTGLYFLALTIMTLMAIVGRLGMDSSVTRFVAVHASESDWAGVKGVVRHAVRLSFLVSLVMAFALFLTAEWLAHNVFDEPALGEPLRYMALAILPFAWVMLYAMALQGVRNVRDSLLMQSVLVPLASTGLLFLLVPLLNISGAVLAYSFAVTLALGYGFWMWRRELLAHHTVVAHFRVSALLSSSFPLLGAMLLQQLVMAVPVLLLGAWAESNEIGLFSAAQRTAGMVSLVLVAANSIVAPKFAALYRQGDMLALGQVARRSALLMTLMASPALLLFLILPEWVMRLFGPEFGSAWPLLVIMALGQLVNVMTGSVGFLLMMTGHERSFLSANALAVLICVGLAALLIPSMGGMGAAIAAAASLAVVNLLRVQYVWRELQIRVFPIASKQNKIL